MSNTIGYVAKKTGISGTQHVYGDAFLADDVMLSSATYADGDIPIQTGADTGSYVNRGLNLDANNRLSGVKSIQLNPAPGTPSQSEGLIFWDSTNKCPAYYNDDTDVLHQVGQELWIRVYNNTGSTILNGKACYLSGIFSGFPTVDLAKADAAATCLSTIGIATHDIEDGTYGYITRMGTVRDLNTTGCTAGSILWLSASSAGDYTETKPGSPNYAVTLGNCGVVDASAGTMEVQVSVGNNTGDVINIFNGSILEQHTAAVSSNGTTISLTLEKTGGGDLSLFFDGAFAFFDSTPAASVSLTAGTSTVPVLNYVFIPKDTNTLTANTTGFDTTQQIIPVATVFCKSASDTQTEGPMKFHAWTDHVADSNDQGHISHVNRWIRAQNATWLSGSQLTATGGANTYDVSTPIGNMLQLHEHAVDAFDTSTGSELYIVNDSTTAYKKVGNLTQEVTDSTGVSMTGKYYKHVFWIAGNEGSGNDKLFCNLPSGFYTSSAAAISDVSKYADYSIPNEFTGTGILIAEVVVQNAGGAGGTFTIHDTTSLRGLVPSTSAGGGGGGGGGAENFTELGDVPSSYTSQALKAVRVNAGETALEFYTPSGTPPVTTKGDLYGYDTDIARIPIGTNNQVLTADSTQALGLKWADPSFSDPMTARGDIIFRNASNVTERLPKGAAGYVLTSDGTDIAWAATAGRLAWELVTADDTIADGEGFLVDPTSADVDVTLPAGSEGLTVGVKALNLTNAINVVPNGTDKIEGVNASTPINADKSGFTLVYSDATNGWVVTTQMGALQNLVTLTDAATIAVDMSLGDDFKVTLGGNRTLGNPTNPKVGQTGHIIVYQDGTGSRTLAYSSNYQLPSGTAFTLTTTASAADVLAYWVETATRIHLVHASKDSK
jgi:hypothetical protein